MIGLEQALQNRKRIPTDDEFLTQALKICERCPGMAVVRAFRRLKLGQLWILPARHFRDLTLRNGLNASIRNPADALAAQQEY